ncbi:MAG: hypothetical protein HW405_229 [Candidatus Berkelbacteria bacterium]|nr:hypothetical protein [Candidatus Berkelbacteria bacterium]
MLVIVLLGFYFLYFGNILFSSPGQTSSPTISPSSSAVSSSSASPTGQEYAFPVARFKERVTKKPFGIYITPQNSPVQPEVFTGYHTGADAEYTDAAIDVPVYAITDGTVVLSRTASGYGGVFMIEIQLNGTPHTILYGHIRPSSLPKVGQKIIKGEQLAVLGTGYSSETDGERQHLHLSILADDRIDVKGYVSSKSQLTGWIDPLSLY